jgi:hypothetical protein
MFLAAVVAGKVDKVTDWICSMEKQQTLLCGSGWNGVGPSIPPAESGNKKGNVIPVKDRGGP